MKLLYFSDGKSIDWSPSFVTPQYDEIVDDSTFRPDSESTRQLAITGKGGDGQPVYDSPDSPPTDLEVKLRSGKLDKAEVSQLQQRKKKEIEDAKTQAEKDKAIADAEAISKARQDFLDKSVGFNGNIDSSKE